MDEATRTHLQELYSADRVVQNVAYFSLLETTESPVGWAYEVWDSLVADLRHHDNHVRAIAAQLLCNLAKSDPDKRILNDFERLLSVTKDERFVTARHCLQSLWKVGTAGAEQRALLVDGLAERFAECESEKNCTLIRHDIIQSLKNVYDAVRDERVRATALALIESEPDMKYRKKYASVWKAA